MSAGFAYVQSRVQARFGELIADNAWQRLDAIRSMSGFLEEARHSVLSHWISGLSLVSTPHHIEQGLRRRMYALILETRGWVPAPWRDAVFWTAWLQELPLLRRLLTDDVSPPWAADTPLLGSMLSSEVGGLRPALRAAGALPLLRELKEKSLEANWLAHWRSLWPACPRHEYEGMQQLIELIVAHGSQFPTLPPEQGWGERKRLRNTLRSLFRRFATQPAALFSWLSLEALELELLRAALIKRAIFANSGRH
jgi:hypothetical protein